MKPIRYGAALILSYGSYNRSSKNRNGQKCAFIESSKLPLAPIFK